MDRKVFRIKDLATTKRTSGLLPVSPATIWRWVASGAFPQPFKLGERTTVWDADQVLQFIAAKATKGMA